VVETHLYPGINVSQIDFVIQENGKFIPIEVKPGENLKAKSFVLFYEKHKSETAIRASLTDYKAENWMTNIPLCEIETV
jgi:hypothetical protein